MNFLVILGSALALYLVMVVLMKFTPDFLDRLGGGPDSGSGPAVGGIYGEGGIDGDGD